MSFARARAISKLAARSSSRSLYDLQVPVPYRLPLYVRSNPCWNTMSVNTEFNLAGIVGFEGKENARTKDKEIFHHAIAKDISVVFKACEEDQASRMARVHEFERLRNWVCAMDSDVQYDLVDTSFGSLLDVPHFYNAPLECTIVDKTRTGGFPPAFGKTALPLGYDAAALANRLTEEGYTGTFIDTKPDFRGYNDEDPNVKSNPPLLFPEPTFGQLTAPFNSAFNVLPPTLRIKPEGSDRPEIHLSPAHPSNVFRWNLLKHACENNSSFRMLSTFFWIWLRSHGIEHFPWTTCAFLVMFYLQHHTPSLETPSDATLAGDVQSASVLRGFWNRIENGSAPSYERVTVPPLPEIANPPTHPGWLIYNFFSFWPSNRHLPDTRILHPLTGTHTARVYRYKNHSKDLDEVEIMKGLKTRAKKGEKEAYWQYNPLVVTDPFLPVHNHALSVSKHALQLMMHKSQAAARALKHGSPITEILGASISPAILPSAPFLTLICGEGALTDSTPGDSTTHQSQVVASVAALRSAEAGTSSSVSSPQRMYHTSSMSTGSSRYAIKLPEDHVPITAPPHVDGSVHAARMKTIQRVQRVIQDRYGKQYLVACFGSTQYGVDSPNSDLDLVVLDQDRKTGFTPNVSMKKLPVIYNVRNLAATLERKGFKINRVIAAATVPIVKFEDPRTHLTCDININDRLGLFNTHLIAQYCSLSPFLRDLLMMVKRWAKSHGLNDPSGEKGTATFSSYALTLMTIGLLQSHELLPNLQAGLPPLGKDEEFWICERNGERTPCDPRFNSSPNWISPTHALIHDLRGALIAWFRFWGHQYNYARDVMSIRDGGVVQRADQATETKSSIRSAKVRKARAEKRARLEAKAEEKARRRSFNGERVKAKAASLSEGAEENSTATGADADAEKVDTKEELVEDDEANVVVDDIGRDTPDDMDKAANDLETDAQPSSWSCATIVIADPFILAKNVTNQLTPGAIMKFTAECRRSLLLLSAGAAFQDLLGDGSAVRRRGRSRKVERLYNRLNTERLYERQKDDSTRGGKSAHQNASMKPRREGTEHGQRSQSTPGRNNAKLENVTTRRATRALSATRISDDSAAGPAHSGGERGRPKYHSGRWRPQPKSEARKWTQRSMAVRGAEPATSGL